MIKKSSPSLFIIYLQLHFIVFIWGFTATLGKLISIPSVEIVFYRTSIACIGLYFLLRIRKINTVITGQLLWYTLIAGVIIAVHWVLFFLATEVSNISVCLAGMATTSFWTSIVDPLMNKRGIKIFELGISLLSVVGIFIVFQSSLAHPLGFVIALVAAFLAAVFTVVNGKLVNHENHYTITYYEMIGAWCVIVFFLPFYHFGWSELQLMLDWADIGGLLILGLICTVYPYAIAVKLMQRLSAFTINLTINLEPVYGILIAFILFQDSEKMTIHFYTGTGIILLSVVLYPILRSVRAKKIIDYFRY